ncbi:hypothetical protein QBC40DRAFT_252959 [Triangularia verruculosa]|uniref:Uncharacterized protein n=1 Tax=Triangularia verruculosa TaxID=2587418 RepID=A0AAN6XPH1_9PEZI|nr:hypothetical protein QBC40DRAFT_252959 [Triangularia verruculosa]
MDASCIHTFSQVPPAGGGSSGGAGGGPGRGGDKGKQPTSTSKVEKKKSQCPICGKFLSKGSNVNRHLENVYQARDHVYRDEWQAGLRQRREARENGRNQAHDPTVAPILNQPTARQRQDQRAPHHRAPSGQPSSPSLLVDPALLNSAQRLFDRIQQTPHEQMDFLMTQIQSAASQAPSGHVHRGVSLQYSPTNEQMPANQHDFRSHHIEEAQSGQVSSRWQYAQLGNHTRDMTANYGPEADANNKFHPNAQAATSNQQGYDRSFQDLVQPRTNLSLKYRRYHETESTRGDTRGLQSAYDISQWTYDRPNQHNGGGHVTGHRVAESQGEASSISQLSSDTQCLPTTQPRADNGLEFPRDREPYLRPLDPMSIGGYASSRSPQSGYQPPHRQPVGTITQQGSRYLSHPAPRHSYGHQQRLRHPQQDLQSHDETNSAYQSRVDDRLDLESELASYDHVDTNHETDLVDQNTLDVQGCHAQQPDIEEFSRFDL